MSLSALQKKSALQETLQQHQNLFQKRTNEVAIRKGMPDPANCQ